MSFDPASSTPSPSLSLEQVALLQEATLAVSEARGINETLCRIAAAARALVSADAVVLFGVDPNSSEFPVLAADGLPERRPDAAHGMEPAVGRVLRERRIVGIEDLTALPADMRRAGGFAEQLGLHSVLAAPLAAHDTLQGALAVYARAHRAWTGTEARLLSLLAVPAAVALQNARLQDRVGRLSSDLQMLIELSHLLGSSNEREALLQAIVDRLVETMGAKYGVFMGVERGESGEAELKIQAHHGFSDAYVAQANAPGGISLDPRHPTGMGPASVAAREIRPVAIGDVFVDERFSPFRSRARAAGYLSVVSVPVAARGQVVGCLVLYFEKRRDFAQSEMNLLMAIADGLALAIERIDLSERFVQDAVAASRPSEAADRLQAEFVSTVSHELRTPLTIIKGYADLLASAQTGELNAAQQKFLGGIQKNTTRLADLVDDLLSVARLESGRAQMAKALLDLGQLVGEACAEYERVAAEKNVTIVFQRERGLPTARGDVGRIAQVVNNFLSNAVKFSPAGSQVDVSCAGGAGEILVSVRDRGPGIPQEAQSRLFQKFYRVETEALRQVGGTGLGLAIAKAIVEQHGGRIWVESEQGVGSTFGFALPAATAA